MTNQDVISVDGLVALKEAGVSDNVIAVMMDPTAPATAPAAPPPAAPPSAAAAPAPPPRPAFPASNVPKEVAPTDAHAAAKAAATAVKDLYRIFPREDVSSGEFGFVEGNTGSKSTSNIEILDVYDWFPSAARWARES